MLLNNTHVTVNAGAFLGNAIRSTLMDPMDQGNLKEIGGSAKYVIPRPTMDLHALAEISG